MIRVITSTPLLVDLVPSPERNTVSNLWYSFQGNIVFLRNYSRLFFFPHSCMLMGAYNTFCSCFFTSNYILELILYQFIKKRHPSYSCISILLLGYTAMY